MAFAGEDVAPEKKTGFTYQGKEIILSKTRGRPPTGKLSKEGQNGYWSEKKKIEALTLFAALGNVVAVAKMTGVPDYNIRNWVKSDWGLRILDEIRTENDHKIDSKFTELVENALEQLGDRIQNGDYVVTKAGDLVRKPVSARDLSLVSAINIDKRQLLRGKPTSRSESVTTEDERLKKLENMFLELAGKHKPEQIEDVDYVMVEPEKDAETTSE